MREVVIVDSVRTGLAKSFRGKFNQTRPDDMAAHCVNALLARSGIDPASVEDCIVGAGSNEGAQGYNICLLYTSPSPRDRQKSRMPSSA